MQKVADKTWHGLRIWYGLQICEIQTERKLNKHLKDQFDIFWIHIQLYFHYLQHHFTKLYHHSLFKGYLSLCLLIISLGKSGFKSMRNFLFQLLSLLHFCGQLKSAFPAATWSIVWLLGQIYVLDFDVDSSTKKSWFARRYREL